MILKNWPKSEQPREKLISKGAHTLSDAELLAVFLRTGTQGQTAVDVARNLLAEFDGLRGLIGADPSLFLQIKGIGEVKSVQLQAVMELARRNLAQTVDRCHVFEDVESIRIFLNAEMRNDIEEGFACLFMDSQHRLTRFERFGTGTINRTHVFPREIVRAALKHNAAATVLVHNHPSGVATPSQADIQLTERLRDLLEALDVRVLDHMVVGDGAIYSFAEHGLI